MSRFFARRDGEPIDLGPDHYARFTAVDRFIKVLTAGRPAPKAVDLKREDGTMTLAEVEARVGGNAEGHLRLDGHSINTSTS